MALSHAHGVERGATVRGTTGPPQDNDNKGQGTGRAVNNPTIAPLGQQDKMKTRQDDNDNKGQAVVNNYRMGMAHWVA